MEQLRKNNLNPTLALGKGTGGQTVSTGNASTGSVGMIDNKISMQDAQNMALLEAQRKNIEADTKLKEADANKTSGVDTDEKKVTIDNIIAKTKNEETKNKLTEVQTNLLKLQETESNMSREARMYEIKMRMRKTTEEVRQLSRNNEIGEETKNEIVEQIKLQTIGARLDNELKKANINHIS